MSWFESLSFRRKLQIGVFMIIGVFSLVIFAIAMLPKIKLFTTFVLIGILIGISIPFLKFLERALTSPIDSISRIALNISNGDFSQQVAVTSDDALGDLAKAFNRMVEKLRAILNDTTAISNQVGDTSRDMNAKNQNLKDIIEQVTTSTTELATGASQISEDVSNISIAIKDIEEMVVAYAHSTRDMNARSDQTIELIEKGRNAVERQNEGMQSNVAATAEVSQTISELAKQAAGITQITRTISDIAEQTNLLSLNASIEAARAGEHGLGFAVVATEVRNLAEESTQSTKEVFELVRTIEQGINQAIQNIEANEEVVSAQSLLIKETEAVFSEIVESIQFIADQIVNFVKESDKMLDGAKQISSTMESISAITQQSAAGTEEVSAAMNAQIGSIEEMVEQSDRMSSAVRQLQRTIEVFKL